jgi:hypothetical protein
MDSLVVPARPGFMVQPHLQLRRWLAPVVALFVLVGLISCVVYSGNAAPHQLLQTASSASPAPAYMEALSIKNAAVKDSIYNTHLMNLIGHAQKSEPVSLSDVAAVRRLSDDDILQMIHNAEAHITAKPAAPQLDAPAPSPNHAAKSVVGQAVTAQSLGARDFKTVASSFEAHLKQEEATAKALMAKQSAHASEKLAHPLPEHDVDIISKMTATLDKAEKADEDKMKEHFLREREKVLHLFGQKPSGDQQSPANQNVEHLVKNIITQLPHSISQVSPVPKAQKSAANWHMVQHLVSSSADHANDAQ